VTDPNPKKRWRAPAAGAAAALLFALVACGDDPFSFDWSDAPDTVQIYSLARPELNLPSGFSFGQPPGSVIVERPGATGAWDVALDTRGGQLVLLPPGALGITARAGIAVLAGVAFDDVVEAPGDTLAYAKNDPVPVLAGTVYVVQTNRRPCAFGASGVYYAKMEPVAIDVAGGVLTFRYVASPICNSRRLTPP
jgi:hypothetical protein